MADPKNIERWKQGKDVWNAWAQEMLKTREELQKAGKWDEEEDDESAEYLETKKWFEEASVDFSNHNFEEKIDCTGWIFPGDAGFRGAQFIGGAIFESTEFCGDALFSRVQFHGFANFTNVKFSGEAEFVYAQFDRNAWFRAAYFADVAEFEEAQFGGYAEYSQAKFNSRARFDKAQFDHAATFSDVLFNKFVMFKQAKFIGETVFDRAQFVSDAFLTGAQFKDYASFNSVQFIGYAGFQRVQFLDEVHFQGTRFNGDANFDQLTIERSAHFSEAEFNANTTFRAIRSKLSFSLADAWFETVPDFVEASFNEPPRLDNLTISVPSIWRHGDRDNVARWRKLKAMAVSVHDHDREMEFFAQETRARRIWRDKLWHAQFWLGVIYELFSNFGRSYLRPICWWFFSFLGFAVFYLYQHAVAFSEKRSVAEASLADVLSAAWNKKLTCIVGQGNPVADAFYLSLKNAAVLIGWQQTSKANQINYCLYGAVENQQGGPIADLPSQVAFWSIGQAGISAVLIFLFLLAIRNHFRIR